METDLYTILGVDRKATKPEIRSAYRKKSKKVHPDSGGSKDDFQRLQIAHRILTDEERRAKYDRDGTVDESSKDQTANNALQLVVQMVEKVISTALSRAHNPNPEMFDIVSDAKKMLYSDISGFEQEIKKVQELISIRRRVAKRFKAKEGKKDVISVMIDNQTNMMERNLEKIKENVMVGKAAINILNDHRFEVDTDSSPYNGVPERMTRISFFT
jgi:curved DNA-binding protein CbpA